TMSGPLLSGRPLSEADDGSSPHVAVINEVMARMFWPDRDPIDQVFRYGGSLSGSFDSLDREFFDHDITVVGVAAVERREELAEEPTAELYRPYGQIPWWSMALVIRTEAPTEAVVPQVREAVWSMDASLPLQDVAMLQEVVAESAGQDRLRSVLSGLFAAVAAALTMVGIYGVTASAVSRRQREIGIRLALGAQASRVRARVLAGGLRSAAVALALGIPLALLASRWVSSFLFRVSPLDPATYGAVVATVLGTSMLACYVPARRASRVDPMKVISSE
ncbi:MAG: FtsX-like permease family protein, partial [Gemmatimonadetes bacterium]|nr:FtsX-like permease family protein [Gemmatimonadota bacterium]